MLSSHLLSALNTAQSFYQQGKWSQAEEQVRRILSEDPKHAKALELLALIAFECGHPEAGADLFQQALQEAPHDALIWCNLGHCYLRQLKFTEALYALQQACNLKLDFAAAHNLRGIVLQELNRPVEAIEAFETTLKLQPSTEVHYNLAVAYRKQERFQEALHATAQVLRDIPLHSDALNNRGLIRQELGQFDKALEDFNQVLHQDPQHGEAHFNKGCLGILLGHLPEAWQDYEWRWFQQGQAPTQYAGKPWWSGEALGPEDHLYVHADAGFGDSLQFVRYLLNSPLWAQGRVTLACQPALLELFKAQQWPFTCISLKDPLPEDITHTIPLLSLPFHHQSSIRDLDSQTAYLTSPNPVQTLPEALQKKALKVGITWSGSPDNSINTKRSCDFKYFEKLMGQFPEVAWISLQKDQAPPLQKAPENFYAVGEQLHSFADTAAWVEALDLVISVDTSLVHLAGALGKTTWVLLPTVPDWRWFLDREDTPWYPQTRLFRQHQRGQWKDLFWQVKKALQQTLTHHTV